VSLDPRTPILVGVGSVTERSGDPTECVEASELMVRAARAAVLDSTNAGMVNRIGAVAAMGSMAGYSDPAQLVADGLGLEPHVRRLRADPGVLQQKVFNWACERVHDGLDAVLVVSGEAQFRAQRSTITGVDVPVTSQPKGHEPDETWTVGPGIISRPEITARMFDAVQHYAMMEFALARACGRTVDEQLDVVAKLMARQSEASVGNADAWQQRAFKAGEVRAVSPANRMVSWPYAKLHNSQINVNQGAALLFTNVATAGAMNIPTDNWIFLRGGVESNFMQPITLRPEVHRAPWVRATSEAALDLAGLEMADINAMELYSCFPVAVQMQAQEMGIDLAERMHSITGGMTFAGGPFNSFVLHATASMVNHLRSSSATNGLVTSISGFVTKHATAVWSTEPPTGSGLRIGDVTAEMETLPSMNVVEDHDGPAEVVAATVVHNRTGPTHALVMAEATTSSGDVARLIAKSEDPDTMTEIMANPDTLASITVTADSFHL